jgi:hypothetical protein
VQWLGRVLFGVVLDNKRARTNRGADEGNTRIGVRDSRLEWLDSTVAAMLITARHRGDTCACEGNRGWRGGGAQERGGEMRYGGGPSPDLFRELTDDVLVAIQFSHA